jgi:hypothetical protein
MAEAAERLGQKLMLRRNISLTQFLHRTITIGREPDHQFRVSCSRRAKKSRRFFEGMKNNGLSI